MEHRRVCFCMLSLLPLVQISKLSRANSLLFGKVCCRTPRGVRGLKYVVTWGSVVTIMSHPSRGAWIEIRRRCNLPLPHSRTPRGVRGLKSRTVRILWILVCRTPRGVRGLKSGEDGRLSGRRPSHPSRGAWIEILLCAADQVTGHASHPSRGAWIEIQVRRRRPLRAMSHPSRGAWIEIRAASSISSVGQVAPLAGCVD